MWAVVHGRKTQGILVSHGATKKTTSLGLPCIPYVHWASLYPKSTLDYFSGSTGNWASLYAILRAFLLFSNIEPLRVCLLDLHDAVEL
jgi:hypothetical protein